MALNGDERRRSDQLDCVLSVEIGGYEPPNTQALKDWRESAPHPAEAVDYDSAELDGSSDS